MSIRYSCLAFICTIFFVLWTLPACAQDTLWSCTYGGAQHDEGLCVQQTADGGYVVVGHSESVGVGGRDVYLIKTHSNGEVAWSRTYGGEGSDVGRSVLQTTDGGYIVVGYTLSFGAGWADVYLIKTNSSGDTLWTRTYGGGWDDAGNAVQQTADGGYIVAGWTRSFEAGYADVYLIKTNADGDTLWTRTYYGGTGWDEGNSVQQTADGGYLVSGWTESFGAGLSDLYVIKTDSTGNAVWTRTYGGSSVDAGRSAQQIADGGFIVAGHTQSFGDGDYDVYLIKIDSTGDTVWNRTFGGIHDDLCYSVQQTTDQGYIVLGYTLSFGAGYWENVYLIKIDHNANLQWSRTFGGGAEDHGQSVRQTMDGGYIVAGYTQSFGAGQRDVMLTKLDPMGNACIGEFVSSAEMSVSCTISSPSTETAFPSAVVTSPATLVTSPPTQLTTVCERVCGDVDGDGLVDMEDVVFLLHYLYMKGQAPDPLEAGNVNGDEIIDLEDVVYLINYVLKGGPTPSC